MATRKKELNMADVECLQKLKKVRTVIKGQLTRIKKLTTGNPSHVEISEKLTLMEDCWTRYKEVQNQIDELADEENVESEIEYRCNMENEYLKLKVEMKTWLVEEQAQSCVTSNEESTTQVKQQNGKSTNCTNLNFTPYQNDESFSNFIKRLEIFLLLKNEDSDEKTKVYILLHSLTPYLHQQLYDICAPENPLHKSYNELVKLLTDYLDPKPSVWALQHKFITRTQQAQENITDFSVALKKISVDCKFDCTCGKNVADMFLSLQFIRGLRDNDIRTKLLQDQNQRAYKDIVQTAFTMELGKSESAIVNTEHRPTEHLHQIHKSKTASPAFDKRTGKASTTKQSLDFEKLKGKCYRCGSSNHKANQCRFQDSHCNRCKKKGHIASVCLQPKENIGLDTHQTENETYEDEVKDHEINNVGGDATDKFMIKIEIEGKSVSMELDTGAALSTISYRNFEDLKIKNRLFKTNVMLRTYTGEPIKPKGVSYVNCTYNSQTFVGKLYIINQAVDPIFGRDWLRQINMNWAEIKSLENIAPQKLDSLLEEFDSVFENVIGVIPDELGHLKLTEGSLPIFIKPRQMPYALIDKVEQELERLQRNGIITKVNQSDWGTPIVPVVKPNGTVRICADYKVTLNKLIKDEKYPIPRIEEIFTKMNGGRYFCTLDISNAYLHMKMDEESALMQTLSTHNGLYRVNRLMFGVKVAPSLWQQFMDKILHGLAGTQCFFDDIIIQGRSPEELLVRLRLVLEKLREKNLKLNRDKCNFFQKSIKYLGHVIDEHGLHKTQEKTDAVKNMRRPKNVNELRTFLGLANYYNKFIKNLATILYPLNTLLKKGIQYEWTTKCEESFAKVKEEITSDNILVHFDPKLPLVLATDASPTGLGAVISHRYSDGSEKPISFASRTLTECEQKYSQIDKEATGIYWGLKKFFPYCYGRKLILITDHKPLVSIFDPHRALPAISATRIFNYAHFLSGFDYTVEFRKTTDHSNVDCLSRFPTLQSRNNVIDDISLYQMNQLDTLLIDSNLIAEATSKDEYLKPILKALKLGESVEPFGFHDNELSLQNGCILKGYRVVIPQTLQKNLLSELHIGHLGIVKMKSLARSHCTWKNIDSDIENMVKTCKPCCMKRNQPVKEVAHPWKVPDSPWERVHIDFAGPLNGQSFFIVVDSYTKWVEVLPTKNTTSDWCIKELQNIFKNFGLPNLLVSDNGSQFTSQVFELFLKENGIVHKTIAPYNPSSNGQAERFVQTVKNALLAMNNEKGTLDLKLYRLLIQMRQVINSSGCSAYEKMFNRKIRTHLSLIHPKIENHLSDENYFQGHLRREFEIGQRVQVRDYRSSKLKWNFGTVVKREGTVNYQVELDDGTLCRRHINQMLSSRLP